MKQFLVLAFVLFSGAGLAEETCKEDRPISTPNGNLVIAHCRDRERYPTRAIVSIDNVKLLERSYLSNQEFDKTRTRWVFRGESREETACPDRLYLIDLSQTPIKVIAFGIKKACNEFHWASWGEKRSVIALKHNVKFTYENGKMILPKPGEKLWSSIEPPHAGEGLAMEDAIPFAEDVPPPK